MPSRADCLIFVLLHDREDWFAAVSGTYVHVQRDLMWTRCFATSGHDMDLEGNAAIASGSACCDCCHPHDIPKPARLILGRLPGRIRFRPCNGLVPGCHCHCYWRPEAGVPCSFRYVNQCSIVQCLRARVVVDDFAVEVVASTVGEFFIHRLLQLLTGFQDSEPCVVRVRGCCTRPTGIAASVFLSSSPAKLQLEPAYSDASAVKAAARRDRVPMSTK